MAFLIVDGDLATECRHPAVEVLAAEQSAGFDSHVMTSYYRNAFVNMPEPALLAKTLWRKTGLATRDIDAAMFYDHFSPSVLFQLEAYGFCDPGDARILCLLVKSDSPEGCRSIRTVDSWAKPISMA